MQLSGNFRSLSFFICLLLSISIVFFRFVYPPVNILSWDVFGYYLYLPARFIYHDAGLHDLSWVNAMVEKYQASGSLYQLYGLPGGGNVIKYSMGLAILNAPAFFIAHGLSGWLGYASDGFSLPYQYAYAISGLAYAVTGVFMLRKILLHFFREKTASLVLILIVAGTNYFQLTAFDGMLSHNYLFTIYTFIVWFTIRWHEKPGARSAILLGLSLGLAVVSRPSELVCVLIPLIWGVYDRDSLGAKWQLIRQHAGHLLLLAGMFLLAVLPQMIYWKSLTTHWIYYSYNNPGEGFDFGSPWLLRVLFSFRKGWFIYTPLMAIAVLGFYSLYKARKSLFPVIFIYFLLNLWIVSSWTCWWYAGGSYSQRALLSSYVLLSLPLGYLLERLRTRPVLLKVPVYSLLLVLLLLNIFQTWQWAHGIIDKTRMSKAYYFAIFGRTSFSGADRKLLMVDRSVDYDSIPGEKNCSARTLAYFDYEAPGPLQNSRVKDSAYSGSYSLKLDSSFPYASGVEIPFKQLTSKEYAWIKISLMVFPLTPLQENPVSVVASFEHKGELYQYKGESLSKEKYAVKTGKWNKITMIYLTPEIRSKEDKLKVYFWLQGQSPVLIDDFRVEVLEPVE